VRELVDLDAAADAGRQQDTVAERAPSIVAHPIDARVCGAMLPN
jgi:hypothetical protein